MLRLSIRRCSSFLARAKEAEDASVLLGRFKSAGRFDRCLETAGMSCLHIGPDGVECELTVTEELSNNFGSLHGGATSTLVDVVGTMALLGRDPRRPGVSVEMNQSFCAAAAQGERLIVEGKVTKYGKRLGFTEVTVRSAERPERVVAIGRHTKFFAS
jgi:acyl-coenzyme A thioesterase 13